MFQRSIKFGALLLLLAGSIGGQTRPAAQRPMDGGVREVLISIYIPSLPSAPFTATVKTETVRALADGSSIILKNHRLIARDKEGRIFQERRLLVPDDGKHESIVTQTEISDPVRNLLYICMPREKLCQLEPYTTRDSRLPPADVERPKGPGIPEQESLGTQIIAGLETVGTRESAVILSGAIGNNSPILSKREYWYSAQLGLNLLSTRQDPRFGAQRFELSDVALGEPDAKLFEPPSGYQVIDQHRQMEGPSTIAATPN